MIGTTLSHYRILKELGRGGMGIVYKAEDTKLDRTVAIKVLPASALTSEADRARFYREAKSAAALNHPNIAQIYQIDEAVPEGGSAEEPRPFIAMEFIDGEPLDVRVEKGPLTLEEAVRLTTQIAQALEVAHEKNIVHRDIKAANVMLTAKGEAKVLDFGLAKTAHSTMLTRMGSTLGTVAYMSPEQARGEEVDGRTDLWALGVLLYQLVSGRLPFGGDYEQAVTYSILNEDPTPLTAIRTGVPMGLEWIVSKLLAKKADDRYQSAKDLIVDLRTVDLTQQGMSRTSTLTSTQAAPQPTQHVKRNPLDLTGRLHPALIAVFILVGAAAGWLLKSPDTAPESGSLKRLTQTVPIPPPVAALDISDDGRFIAIGTDDILVMDVTAGTSKRYDVSGVFVHLDFSPSGSRLLITTSVDIQVLSLDTGTSLQVVVTQEGGPRAEWVDEERIVYEERTSIWERSLITGAARQVIELDSTVAQYDMDFPHMMPDGKTLITTAQYRNRADQIAFWDLETGKNLAYIDVPGTRVQFAAPSHLVFVQLGDLLSMEIDVDNLTQAGPLTPIDRNVRSEGLSVSKEGTLVHVGAQVGVITSSRPVSPMMITMVGASLQVFNQNVFESAKYRSATVSPDGTQVLATLEGELGNRLLPESDIWLLDFRNGNRRRISNDGNSDFAAWNATGDSLYYVNRSPGSANTSVMIRAVSGQGAGRVVADWAVPYLADLDASPDGRLLVGSGGLPPSIDASSDIFLMDLTDPSRFNPTAMRGIPGPNGNPRYFSFSPDSRYIAFEDQGGIFVVPTEDPTSPPIQVFETGMTLPKWGPDGDFLYALKTEGSGVGVPIRLEPSFSVLGATIDYSEYWWGLSTSFFDTMPVKDQFLASFPDNSEVEQSADSLLNGVDLSIIVNLPKAMGANK